MSAESRRSFLQFSGAICFGVAATQSNVLSALNFADSNESKKSDKKKEPIVNKTKSPLMPTLKGEWWTVATKPELGEFYKPGIEPVDFAIWQAADGTWQIWSCVRKSKLPKGTRLFHRWEGKNLTDKDWKAMGIAMQAEEKYGETPGSIQAPHVIKDGDKFVMFYGDWVNICKAESKDGKTFERVIQKNGKTAMFTNGPKEINTRDPMVIKTRDTWHCYYTAHPDNVGEDYCRTSKDLSTWSESVTVSNGGRAAAGLAAAECPFVVEPTPGHFYLFRTYNYFARPKTLVYYSTDPLNFGKDEDDKYLLTELPVAAPEIFKHEDQYYVAALLPQLDGIRISKLDWAKL